MHSPHADKILHHEPRRRILKVEKLQGKKSKMCMYLLNYVAQNVENKQNLL
jgi:hypothetical protein